MRPVWRRTLTWGLPVLLVALALAYTFRPQPVPVDLAPVTRGDMQVSVGDEGHTRVRDVYVVSAPLNGEMERVKVKVGDAVVAGKSEIVVIRPSDPSFLDFRTRSTLEAEVSAAEAAEGLAKAEVKRARAELNFARSELKRARELTKRNTISQRALELAELEVTTREAALAQAEASLRVRRHELATARARLIEPGQRPAAGENCCVTVRAPVSGRVLRVFQESEGVISAGQPIVEIGDPRDLEIVVDLLSSDAVRVEEGAPVVIRDWGGKRDLKGVVRRVEPYGFTKVSALGIEEQRVNVIIDFSGPPEGRAALGHGYRVDVRIVVWQGAGVLKVPMSALFREGGDWAVFVDNDGRAERRLVRIGHLNDREAEVLGGLKEGEKVVLHPSDRVTNGVELQPR